MGKSPSKLCSVFHDVGRRLVVRLAFHHKDCFGVGDDHSIHYKELYSSKNELKLGTL